MSDLSEAEEFLGVAESRLGALRGAVARGDDACRALDLLADLRADLDQVLSPLVAVARSKGKSWDDIADAMSMDRATIADRFRFSDRASS